MKFSSRQLFSSQHLFSPGRIEGFAWVIALLIPAFIEPGGNTHFSWCLFKNAGIEWCPGCGLGESIALFYRGSIAESLHVHPFGIAAVLILFWRIITIFFINRHQPSNQTSHEPEINDHDSRY